MSRKLGGSTIRTARKIEDYQVPPVVIGSYTIQPLDYLIRVDSIDEVANIQLPNPAERREFKIVNSRYSNFIGFGNGVNLLAFGDEKVGRYTGSKFIMGGYISIEIYSDGVNYHVSGSGDTE
jgi:hypothetical protein